MIKLVSIVYAGTYSELEDKTNTEIGRLYKDGFKIISVAPFNVLSVLITYGYEEG